MSEILDPLISLPGFWIVWYVGLVIVIGLVLLKTVAKSNDRLPYYLGRRADPQTPRPTSRPPSGGSVLPPIRYEGFQPKGDGVDESNPPTDLTGIQTPMVVVGHCPVCGAPIYGTSVIREGEGLKIRFSCSCVQSPAESVGPMEMKSR